MNRIIRVVLATLLLGFPNGHRLVAAQQIQVTLYDSQGKVAYSGPASFLPSPCNGDIEEPNPQGRGTIKIPDSQVVECSFVRVAKPSISQRDIDTINERIKNDKSGPSAPKTLDEYLQRYPLSVKRILINRKQYIDTPHMTETVKFSLPRPDGTVLELTASEFGKLVVKR